MARVFVNDTTLTAIADAIREKNGSENTYKPSEMGNAVRNIENWLDYAVSLKGTFGNAILNNLEELNVSFGSKAQYDASRSDAERFVDAFYRIRGVKKVVLKCEYEISEAQILQNTFSGTQLEVIDISNFVQVPVYTWYRTFYYSSSLRKIIGEIDFSNATDTTQGFMNLDSLEEIRVKKGTLKFSTSFAQSSKLSDASRQSIIDGLATVSTAQTLTFHKTVYGKLTEEQKAQATSKNWTLAQSS